MLHHSPVLNATLAGRAPSSHVLAKETLTFQSAYPRGTQHPTQFRDTTWNGCFNPRAHVGRAPGNPLPFCRPLHVSIYTPAWSATRQFQHYAAFVLVSIHAPAWGATWSWSRSPGTCRCFNPRARVGRDRRYSLMALPDITFQSTRPCGARLAA